MRKILLVIFYFIVSFIPTIIMIPCSLIGNLLVYITNDLINVVDFLNNTIFGRTFVVWTISLLILFVCHILMDNAKNFIFITDIIMNKVFNPFTQWIEVHYEKA